MSATRSAAPRRARGGASNRTRRRLVAGLMASLAFVGLLLVGVFPTQSWLNQRHQISSRSTEVAELRKEERRLEARKAKLRTPSEVERLARKEYGLVRPGEDAYALLPPKAPAVDLPEVWPLVGADDLLNR